MYCLLFSLVDLIINDNMHENNQLDSSAYGSMDEMDDMPSGLYLHGMHIFGVFDYEKYLNLLFGFKYSSFMENMWL